MGSLLTALTGKQFIFNPYPAADDNQHTTSAELYFLFLPENFKV
ncbi:MAG: hypothetical protein ABW168_16800 [Sedimenticola sp.]